MTKGMGLAIATDFALRGAAVMLGGLGDAVEIERMRRALIKDSSADIQHSNADMRGPQAIATMIEAARSAFGSIDTLTSNAGNQRVAPIDEYPIKK